MKISLDLDGTILSHIGFFREFAKLYVASGHEVGILTAHRSNHRRADKLYLRSLSFPDPMFWIDRPYGSNENYAEFKAKAIIENGIDLHFDDCDFGKREVESSMRAILGDQQHRLIKVTPRFPEDKHYE